MPKYGSIPTKLKVFLRHRVSMRGVDCTSAFVTDADKPNTHETARRWATRPQYNPLSAVVYPGTKVEGLNADNTPIPHVTLVGTESRGEGGFAFKVVTPQGWLVDLRREEFYEVLFNKGIPKSGKMGGAVPVGRQRLPDAAHVGRVEALQGDRGSRQGAEAAPQGQGQDQDQ